LHYPPHLENPPPQNELIELEEDDDDEEDLNDDQNPQELRIPEDPLYKTDDVLVFFARAAPLVHSSMRNIGRSIASHPIYDIPSLRLRGSTLPDELLPPSALLFFHFSVPPPLHIFIVFDCVVFSTSFLYLRYSPFFSTTYSS
jgi:hypothetical protein